MESVEGPEKTARYSFIGVDPLSTFRSKRKRVEIDGQSFETERSYDALRHYFYSMRCGKTDIAPFCGGLVGYIGYGMVSEFEQIPVMKGDPFPDMQFMVPRHLVCIDHVAHQTFLITHGNLDELKEAYHSMKETGSSEMLIVDRGTDVDQEKYEKMVGIAKENILDGDVFQIVLSRKVLFDFHGDPLELYSVLRRVNPSPYMYLLDFGEEKIIGSSPEMLARLDGRRLTTRPLAGTRPRNPDPEEDEKLKLEMLLDEKERAEHLMLVDLQRNDMGKVSKAGTVKVTELMNIEKFSHVQHMVSNIESVLEDDVDAFDAIKACFPAGTVTGAPKVRAMELIAEYECLARGPYAGAVGYFDFNGDAGFAITIRSIMIHGYDAFLQAGAGIVHDSVPEKEFIETKHKMGALLLALMNREAD
ncbi:MAG: anthranilate synthase component [Candidatus Methanomethylophilaceae archaeon]|nr:anthranilate synthase component [Candidatus Methanomethylophilaceae archaeon]MDI3541972.1 anthranilate synthase component [Candidatus Methanomethylophilaceae archaeon]HIJ00830.1 anthranilate synthase component I family protein [Candidatus Methanomethylophilaceae archaeon]